VESGRGVVVGEAGLGVPSAGGGRLEDGGRGGLFKSPSPGLGVPVGGGGGGAVPEPGGGGGWLL